jgi:hypothetical protein
MGDITQGGVFLMNSIPASSSNRLAFAYQLVAKLERLSADSYWAHQASGLRGSLLRTIADFESTPQPSAEITRHLEELIESAYQILVKAAQEIS